jgi:molecular chaperone DnaK (HSP70)
MDKSRLVYGIDLGTTYSCIAQVDKFDQPTVLRNFEGDATTPSVVHINGKDVIVGKEAKSQSTDENEYRNVVSFIKRHIGVDKSFEKPTPFPNNLDPVEISSLILKKLVQDANAQSDNPEPIKKAVITCPAYFGTKERMQTKQAGILAGLDVLGVINEPTAAAISYGIRVGERKVILVYDLGGGTFDVTIIRVDGGIIKVVATGGDYHLGGVDWDTLMAEYVLGVFNEEHGSNYTLDDAFLKSSLLYEVEQKKKTLTARPKVNINFTHNGASSRVEITRELFNQLTETKLNETIDKTREVLKIAKEKGFDRLDEVLLVGGSSRMPQIKERVDKEFGCNARLDDPDECVAKGAAIFAVNEAYAGAVKEYEDDIMGKQVKPHPIGPNTRTAVVNVTSKTYGTDISDKKVSNLIFANASLPAKAEDIFKTSKDNQTNVSMKIYESAVSDIDKDEHGNPKNRVIEERYATLLVDRQMPISGGYPVGTDIKVTFTIDKEGMLYVHSEVANEPPLDFELQITGVRSAEELQQAAKKLSTYELA